MRLDFYAPDFRKCIVAKATPGPVFRICNQSTLHGVAMDVMKLLVEPLVGANIVVAVTLLPKRLGSLVFHIRCPTSANNGQMWGTVQIAHYYSTNSLKAKIVNLIARGKIARDTQATLDSAKRLIESRVAGARSSR